MVALRVHADGMYRRDGANVHVDVPVGVALAALGGKTRVPTLDGDVLLTVPKGTQPGTSRVMRGKGIRRLRGEGRGDQYVHFKVSFNPIC